MNTGPDESSQVPTRDEAATSASAPLVGRENARRSKGPRAARVRSFSNQAATCYLSLLVPAYNEENRLPATLQRIAEYLALRDFSYELIVVDDGSSDRTRELVREFAATRPYVRLECYDDENGKPLNKGKGYAIRHGVLAARGRDILFSDADLSTPIEEMEKLLPPISRGDCDITIASRALPESKLAVHQPWYRERMGRFFNSIVQRVIDTEIVDTQCGFKAFRGDVAKHLFSLAKIDGFGFDTEIVFLAQKFGYKIEEVPVTWIHKDDSRVNPLRAPFQMMGELLEVRLHDIRGRYDESDDSPDGNNAA